jgi:hypothetical protein
VQLVDGDVVAIGDKFRGRNISHFTLCWMNRVGMFCAARPDRAGSATFVGPATPGAYHEMVLAGVCRAYGLDRRQFVFPPVPVCLQPSGRVFWFSDSGWTPNSHPAHLLHPESVLHLRRLGHGVRAVAGGQVGALSRRVYISRADAAHRRVANEDELLPLLAERGFQVLQLARMPPAEQTAAIAAADIVVAPHGAGLTHLAFTSRRPKVVELFNPHRGTDAYCGLARSLGCDYRWLLGTEVPGGRHFSINPEELAAAIDG